jgi:hypothetical protein
MMRATHWFIDLIADGLRGSMVEPSSRSGSLGCRKLGASNAARYIVYDSCLKNAGKPCAGQGDGWHALEN